MQQKKALWLAVDDEYLDERKRRMSLRRHSMNASMFDPLYTRDVIRRSHDDLSQFGEQQLIEFLSSCLTSSNVFAVGDNFFDLFQDFSWESSSEKRTSSVISSNTFNNASPTADFSRITPDSADDDSIMTLDLPRKEGRGMVRMRQSFPLFSQRHQKQASGKGLNSNGYGSTHTDERDMEGVQSSMLRQYAGEDAPPLKYESLRDLRRKGGEDYNVSNGRKRTSSISTSNSAVSSPLHSKIRSSFGGSPMRPLPDLPIDASIQQQREQQLGSIQPLNSPKHISFPLTGNDEEGPRSLSSPESDEYDRYVGLQSLGIDVEFVDNTCIA